MPDFVTPNYDLILPTVGDEAGADQWGEKLNNNFSKLDQQVPVAIASSLVQAKNYADDKDVIVIDVTQAYTDEQVAVALATALANKADATTPNNNNTLFSTPEDVVRRANEQIDARLADEATAIAGINATELLTPETGKASIVANAKDGLIAQVGAGAVEQTIGDFLRGIEVTPEQFGALNDGDTPDDDAFDKAYNYLMSLPNGGTLVFKAGVGYRLNTEHNVFPFKPLGLHWETGAELLCGLVGVDKVMIDASHPTTDGTRGRYLRISGDSTIRAHASTAGQVLAKYLRYRFASDFKIDGGSHRWLHYGNNTVVEITAPFNCDLGPLTVWGGGHRKPRKSTGNALFSIAGGATALSSDTSIFGPEDVGDIIVIHDEVFTISARTDDKNVTVSEPASRTITNWRGSFGAVRATATAGSDIVDLDASVAVASDIGRDFYIMDADASGAWKTLHRAIITERISATQVRISPAPTASVTLAEAVFSPAVAIWHDTGSQIADIVWEGLHIEEVRGCGLVTGYGFQAHFPEVKLHGQNGVHNNDATDYCAIFTRTSGTAHGIAEGTACGRLGRIVVTGTAFAMFLGPFEGVAIRGRPYIHSRYMAASGIVTVGNIGVVDGIDSRTVDRIVENVGSGRIEMVGKVYNNEFVTNYPYSVGPRIRQKFLPENTKHYVGADAGNPSYTVFGVGGGSPAFRGVGLSGTADAPTASGDYQSVAAMEGWALAPSGTNPEPVARIVMSARNPSGANIGGEIVFLTKLASGDLAARWVITDGGGIAPIGDGALPIGWTGGRISELHVVSLFFGSGRKLMSGTGTPEGAVAAPIGSIYTREDGGSGTTFYVKESGTGNTGWVAK